MKRPNNFNDISVGLDGTAYSDTQEIVPDSIRFKTIKTVPATRRVPVILRADNPTYSPANNSLLYFDLPNQTNFDFRKGYLKFTAAITKTGGTYARFHNGVFSIFNRLRILFGATEIEDLQYYNRIYSILWEITQPILVTSTIAYETMGFGTQVDRNTWGALASKTYICPIFSGVLGTELLPFDVLKNRMRVEFYLENPLICVETDGTNPQYTISSVEFHFHRLELDPSYRSRIATAVSSRGLCLGFHTWDRYTQALTTGIEQTVTISQKSSSISGMIHIFVKSDDINVTTVNDKFITWLPLTISSTSLNINGKQFPDEPIICSPAFDPFITYLEWEQKWKLSGLIPYAPPINYTAFSTNRFFQIDNLEPFPDMDDIVNPFNTVNNTTSLQKRITFSAAIPANYELDTWIESFRKVYIYTDGTARVYL